MGFILNPVDESCHLWVFTQCLSAGVIPRQLSFCKYSMDLLMANTMQIDRDRTSS